MEGAAGMEGSAGMEGAAGMAASREASIGASPSRRGRRYSMDEPLDLRLVLVGKTGAGKSSSGNTILGRNAFSAAVSQGSVTRQCCKETGRVCGRNVAIIDTPGVFDTFTSEQAVKREISKCINMSAPGPHAILVVVKVGRFTDEERAAVKQVEEIFGPDAWRYAMVLFTEDQQPGAGVEALLREAGGDLQALLRKVPGRYHVLNNHRAHERGQVLGLLEKVEKMLADNEGKFYSNCTYVEAAAMLEKREAELRQQYEALLAEKLQALASEYDRRLNESQQDRRQLEERHRCEMEELKRFYRLLESGARELAEQTTKDDFENVFKKFHETLKLN